MTTHLEIHAMDTLLADVAPVPVAAAGGGFLVFAVAFVAMWFGVLVLLSRISGWPALAARFPDRPMMDAVHLHFRSGSMRTAGAPFPVSFRSCLTVRVGSDGLGLSLFGPFAFRSPPLCIPWSEIEHVDAQRTWFWPLTTVRVRGSDTEIRLLGAPGKAVQAAFTARH